MTSEPATPSGPDLTLGIELADFDDGMLLGHVGQEEVLRTTTLASPDTTQPRPKRSERGFFREVEH